MDIERLRALCMSFPGATEDVKWGNDLCFSVGGKMFCVTSLEPPLKITVKVGDDEFDELCSTESIAPAEYVGRFKWITVSDSDRFSDSEWKTRIGKSYEFVRDKLPKKFRENLGKL